MNPEITLDDVRRFAKLAGLNLSEDELQRLVPGINRAKKQAAELRDIVAAEREPASIFVLTNTAQK
jgi:Asp-tRNA(Asn)/Glu-tRNA(Gln) amidotransferase C subunit